MLLRIGESKMEAMITLRLLKAMPFVPTDCSLPNIWKDKMNKQGAMRSSVYRRCSRHPMYVCTASWRPRLLARLISHWKIHSITTRIPKSWKILGGMRYLSISFSHCSGEWLLETECRGVLVFLSEPWLPVDVPLTQIPLLELLYPLSMAPKSVGIIASSACNGT